MIELVVVFKEQLQRSAGTARKASSLGQQSEGPASQGVDKPVGQPLPSTLQVGIATN
jgi:hypothetical protein